MLKEYEALAKEVRIQLVDSAMQIICESTGAKYEPLVGNEIFRFEGLSVSAVNEINRKAPGIIDSEPWNGYPGNRVFLDLFSQFWFEASNLKWLGYVVSGERQDARVTFEGFTIQHEVQNAEDHKRYHDLFMDILSYGPDEQEYHFDGKNLRLYVWWD